MTAPMLMTDCPTEETLAAYIDDRLDAPTRRKVTEHISSCGECRDLVLMATDFQMSEAPANVVRGKFGWIATAAALAAAAVLAIFVLRPAFVYGPQMDDLRAASEGLEFRPGLARIADGLSYKEKAPTFRGGASKQSDSNSKAQLLLIAADAKDPHVGGLALLLTARDGKETKEAVDELEAAYAGASGEKRDAIANDLAAALLTYGERWANDKTFTERALALSEDLWKRRRAPEAAWNRAVALESLGRDDAAIQAWGEYLALDPSSEWAKEAANHRRDLIEFKR